MAAGLGFKTFTTGEVLTAADTNGYLMQGVLVFASTAARDAAITSPQEGQFAYTKDTNGLWYYDGAVWVASGATGDIEGVTAGTGISGGGTSGTVTITNSMATAIDAKGDLVAGTGADTFAKLSVGADGTTLVADSAEATGLKWATASAGGMTSIASGNFSGAGASLSITGIPSGYVNLFLVCSNFNTTGGAGSITIRLNSDTGANYGNHNLKSGTLTQYVNGNEFNMNQDHTTTTNARFALNVLVSNYADTTAYKQVSAQLFKNKTTGEFSSAFGGWLGTNAVTSIQIGTSAGTYAGGTYNLYGVK